MGDLELEILRRKKLMEMRRLLEKKRAMVEVEAKKRKIDPGEVLERVLDARGREVLRAARLQYPEVTRYVERALARLISEGRIRGRITGEELYGLFYRLGFRVRLKTRIQILEHGRVKSLHEKIRESLREEP